MPSTRQGGGRTLTFSKKNEDVKEILDNKSEKKGFIFTDYVCEAIRFYEKNKDKNIGTNDIDMNLIESLVEAKIAKMLSKTQVEKDSANEEISIDKEDYKICGKSLESDLDFIDTEED